MTAIRSASRSRTPHPSRRGRVVQRGQFPCLTVPAAGGPWGTDRCAATALRLGSAIVAATRWTEVVELLREARELGLELCDLPWDVGR